MKSGAEVTDSEAAQPAPSTSKGPKFGCRHTQAALLCMALIFGVGTRTNLSVAIVAMTDNTTSPNPNVPTYDWNNTSVILSSFFWSYVTLQIAAGYLGKTYGPKYFLLGTYLLNCCTCALIPTAAALIGSNGVIACRVIQGLTQAFLYPSVHVMLGTWAPDEERATLNNFVFSGVQVGTIYASILTGFVSASWLGWTYSFYILALMGFLWCILWAFFGQNSPATHPRITQEEKKYIQSSLKQEDNVQVPVPWKKIFTCLPFYSLICAYIGNLWGYAILMTETPTYLSKIMQFDVKSNAVINALPTVAAFICTLMTGPLADWIVSRKFLSVTHTRKAFHIVGSFGQAACLIWLSFLTKTEAYLSVVVLILGTFLTTLLYAGGNVNHLDLSPRFSGVLFGILNATGQVASIVAPLAAQWIIKDQTSLVEWRTLFLISSGFYIVGAVVFGIFGTAKRQAWDGPEIEPHKLKKHRVSIISLAAK